MSDLLCACLQGKLPDWIHLPASAALPFGTFEAVLADSRNAGIAAEIQLLQQQLQGDGAGLSESLGAIRSAVLHLEARAEVLPQLQSSLQDAGGLSRFLLSCRWRLAAEGCLSCAWSYLATTVSDSIVCTNASLLLPIPCLTVTRRGRSWLSG